VQPAAPSSDSSCQRWFSQWFHYVVCSFSAMLAMARSRYAVVLPAFQQHTTNSSSGLLDLKPLLDETMQRQAAEALTAGCKACQGVINAGRWLVTPSESTLYAVNYTAGCAHSCLATCLASLVKHAQPH
jgi:hypothetical protein